jgi:hypothetical protein
MENSDKKKIMIGGSMAFETEAVNVKKALERIGYEVFVSLYLDNPKKKSDAESLRDLGGGISDIELATKVDAVVILNYPNGGVNGYISEGAYRDLSVAWWSKKKIFFLFPRDENHNGNKYAMFLFEPIILDGDVKNIKKYL